MKRKTLPLFLALAVLLAGCACRHEWQDADCTHGQICAKCQEETGDPLGHSWQDATCDTPQTCTRCGATQGQTLGHDWAEPDCTTPATCRTCGLTDGEALGHDYDIWTLASPDMTHTCRICGNSETVPYDALLYSQDQLLGWWELFTINFYSYTYRHGPVYSFNFAKDFTVSGNFQGKEFTGTWELEQAFDAFYSGVMYISGEAHTFTYDFSSNQLSMPLYDSEGERLCEIQLKRVDDVQPLLTGTWTAEYEGTTYQLKLMEDRTFLASFDIPFHGKWYIYPTRTNDTSSNNLIYVDGSGSYENRYYVFALTRSLEEGTGSTEFYTIFQSGEDKVCFTQTSTDGIATAEEAETLRTLQEAAAEAKKAAEEAELQAEKESRLADMQQAIAGHWVSRQSYLLSDFDALMAENPEVIDVSGISTKTTEYSITMDADGSFTGALGAPVTGTWELDGDSFYGETNYSGINGTLTFADSQDTCPITLSYSEGYGYSMHLEWNGLAISFLSYTPEELSKLNAGSGKFTGTWGHCAWGIFVDDTATLEDAAGCSLTFQKDGTLSGVLPDREVTGTWTYCGYDPNGDYYTATVVIDGQKQDITLHESYGISFTLTNAQGQTFCYSFEK